MNAEEQFKRLRWRCRRGMRELDALLMRFVEQHYAAASCADQEAFERLLRLPDPEILGLLMGRSLSDDPRIGAVVDMIRGQRIH